MKALRFDYNGSPSSFKRTPQGFLRVKACLSRTGILDYQDQREYRSEEEVFREDSLASIKGAPVTDLHPSEKGFNGLLTPANAREHIIGLAESVEREGRYLKGSLIIFHEDAIKAIESGERKEISLGYQCQIEKSPGTYQGETYDALQKNIVVNHIALGPKGWGRAGPECSIRKDSISPPTSSKGKPMTETLRLDGVDIALTAANIKSLLEEKKKQVAEYQGRLDAIGAELEKERARRAELEKPELIEAKVNARLGLIATSKVILGDEFRFDGKTEQDIKKAVIAQHSPHIELKDKGEAYINAAFEIISSAQHQRNDSLSHTRASLEQSTSPPGAQSSYEKWVQSSADMWQSALSGSISGGRLCK